jgi:hypothetical protein
MHWRSTEMDGADVQMELEVNTKCQMQSKQSELVRTCQDRMELVQGYFCCM